MTDPVSQATAPPIEQWHRGRMQVIWTDTGKLGVKFWLPNGAMATQFFEVPEGAAKQLTALWRRRELPEPPL